MRTASPRSASSADAGFTLVELMVVITIISIVAVLAIPSMTGGGYDRRVFTDAATIAEIVREARTRAVGRGAAQLLAMTTNTPNTATFILYESVTSNPGGGGGANVPVGTCGSPTVWPQPSGSGTSTANFVDEYQFAGGQTLEGQGNIVARITDPTGTAVSDGVTEYLCFSPSGRVQYQSGAPTAPFLPMAGSVGAMVVELTRGGFSGSFPGDSNGSDLVRVVWIPPSGATRISTQ